MPLAVAQERWFSNAGLRLHAVTAGPSDGPLVFLLHGFPEFWFSWRHQLEPLARAGYFVIALDQRGYNLSDKPAGLAGYTTPLIASDVLSIADSLSRSRFFVAGHDWGAVIAWWLAAQHPDRVVRAAILNVPHPRAFRSYLPSHPSQWLRSYYMGLFQLPHLPEALLSAADFRLLERTLRSTSRPNTFTGSDLQEYRDAWAQPGALTAMVDWYRAAARVHFPQPGRVTIPTLILWGVRDAFIDPALAPLSAALCDDPRLRQFPDATHWLHQEFPSEVTGELLQFFR